VQVVVVGRDQRRPLPAVQADAGDREVVATVVGDQDHRVVVRCPAGHLVVRELVVVGERTVPALAGQAHAGGVRLERQRHDRDGRLVVGHVRRHDVPTLVEDHPLLPRDEVAHDDVHVDVVATVGGVDERVGGDVEDRRHVVRVRDDRREVVQSDRGRRQLGDVERGDLPLLVAAVVVLDQDGA
jgi:hypothetical protein